MNRVVQIIMDRDNMNQFEAEELVNEVTNMIIENPDLSDEILMDELGLEPDYLFDLSGNYYV